MRIFCCRANAPNTVSWAGLLRLGIVVGACGGEGVESSPPASAPPVAAIVESPVVPSPSNSPLSGILDHAIEAPTPGDSTYRIDSYVAAWVLERLRRDPSPFVPWQFDGDEPGVPSAGYRMGPVDPQSLWARLGLEADDIVETINGVSTTTDGWVDQALALGKHRITVGLFRDGVSFVLSYRLGEGMAWEALIKPYLNDGYNDDPPPGMAGGVTPEGSTPNGLAPPPRDQPGHRAPPKPSNPRPRVPDSGRPRPSSGAVARCSNASTCTLDRAFFNQTVRSPATLQAQAKIVPAIRDDVFSGYKLKSVRSGSALHQLGFRSGDKVTHVNGRDLTNDLQVMQLYAELSRTQIFRVRYVRGGATKTTTIKVQ